MLQSLQQQSSPSLSPPLSPALYSRTIRKDDFICTPAGVYISRQATVTKAQMLETPQGRVYIGSGCSIRSDLAPIQLQKYVLIDGDCSLMPGSMPSFTPTQLTSDVGVSGGGGGSNNSVVNTKFIPMTIGSHSQIGQNCTVESASIGSGCWIGPNCTLGSRTILKDFVRLEEGSVVPPDMVIPPFSVVAGCPARIIGSQCESATIVVINHVEGLYKSIEVVS